MKEQNENEKKKPRMNREKKFYLFTALACAAALVAIIVVAIAVTGEKKTENETLRPPVTSESGATSEPGENENPGGGEPVGGLPDGMISPLGAVSVSNDFGFYHNQTLNSYYAHSGMDFAAAVGTEVFAVEDGVVESIYKDDLLSGTEITVSHGDGLKSVYRFVTEADGLKVGAQVKKGDVIATVAEATGSEYKDGAHLHFEILKDGKSVDPALHLTLDEK